MEYTNDYIAQMQDDLINAIVEKNSGKIIDRVAPIIDERIEKKYGTLPEIHEFHLDDIDTKVEGFLHEKFDEVLKMVRLGIPVFLEGAAGTGKNVICQQIAEALKMDFYFTNAVTQEYKLTGFIDANGTYHETQFYKAFTNGGLFMLDEMDASIPETLIILNAAIANHYFDFPTGRVNANENFRVVAAGNTIGLGADDVYTGRYVLDRATLDRFAVVKIDYSPKIEMALAKNDKDLVAFAQEFRKAADRAGVKCLFTYRAIERIKKLDEVLNDPIEVLNVALLKGLSQDDVHMIVTNFSDDFVSEHNEYPYWIALQAIGEGQTKMPGEAPAIEPKPKKKRREFVF